MRSVHILHAQRALYWGVILWCIDSLVAVSSTTSVLVAIFGIGLAYARLAQTTPSSPDLRRWRLQRAVLASGCGLVLRGASRLLLPACRPAAVVGVAFAVSCASSISLAALRRAQFGMTVWRGTRRRFHAMVRDMMILHQRYIVLGFSYWRPIKNPAARAAFRFVWTTLGLVPVVVVLLAVDLGWYVRIVAVEVMAVMSSMCHSAHTAVWMRARRRCRRRVPAGARPFTYQPLAGSSRETPKIRLLRLRRRWPFNRISCELVTTDLHSGLAYDAVSYCWGGSSPTEDIYLHGKTLKLAPHVEELLYHLSSYTRDRLLWIDALCINQSDPAEKDIQIPLMRDVYRRAASVIIWLDGAKLGYMARALLRGTIRGTDESRVEVVCAYAQPGTDPSWAQLVNLYGHPWFFRAWVVQEVTLAKKAIVLTSGGQQLPWDDVVTFAETTQRSPYQRILQLHDTLNPAVLPDGLLGRHHADLLACFARRSRTTYTNLADLLAAFAEFHATLDADRIYALLGLLRPEEADQPHLRPDSSKPAAALYADVAQDLIPAGPGSILSFAGVGYARRLGALLPSWTPDWTSLAPRDTHRQHLHKAARLARFACTQGAALRVEFPGDRAGAGQRRVMRILGHAFDVVQHVGDEMGVTGELVEHPSGQRGASVTARHREVLRSHMACRRLVLAHARRPYPTGQPLGEVFWRSLIADTSYVADLAADADSPDLPRKRPAPAALGVACGLWEVYMQGLGVWEFADAAINALAQRMVVDWDMVRNMPAVGRTVAVTERGYVAVVPPRTRVGDLVCALYGLDTPFVLRREDTGGDEAGNRFLRLAGEAYVHGMMDGEAMTMAGMQPEFFNVV